MGHKLKCVTPQLKELHKMGNSVSDFKESKSYIYRDRIQTSLSGSGRSESWNNAPANPYPGQSFSAGSLARCVDVNHPQFHRFMRNLHKLDRSSPTYKKLRNLDLGDSFAKESVTVDMLPSVKIKNSSTILPRGYDGLVFPSTQYYGIMNSLARGSYPTIPSTLGIDKSSLIGYGATAVKKSMPDIPEFSLFRFVGELRVGLPKIPLKVLAKEKRLRDTGGEYLNYQFGIVPLIGDLQRFIQQLQDPKFRAALQVHLDKEFRIRKVLDKGQTSERRVLTSAEKSVAPNAGGTGFLTTSESYRIWSSCSFAYFQLTELDRLLADFDRMTGGLGVIPTAIDIWNLVPWSWLVDWFTNLNHVITNVSFLGRDGLYFRRGYIMGHYTSVVETSRSNVLFGTAYSSVGRVTCDRKYRVRASPFGFGLTWKEFDPFQLSILGALGVSRLRF